MSNPSGADPWLVVDHALLVRLGPHAPRAEWEKTLKDAGLWDIEGLDGPEGKHLEEVLVMVRAWPDETDEPPARTVQAAVRPYAFAGAGLGLWATIASGDVLPALVGFLAAGAVLAGASVLTERGIREEGNNPRPIYVQRATWALRTFLAQTFVRNAGHRGVENTPHLVYLELRLAELDRALDALGADLERLDPTAARERLVAVRALVAEQLADVEQRLHRGRAEVTRRVRATRDGALTDSTAGPDVIDAAATAPPAGVDVDVDVDVDALEAQFRALALDKGEPDPRLRTVLQVVGSSAP